MSQNNYSLNFQRNELLNTLVQRITMQRTLDWKVVSNRFKDTALGRNKVYRRAILASRVSEISFNQALENFSKEYDGRIQCNPIPNHTSTTNYNFSVRKDELIIHERYV